MGLNAVTDLTRASYYGLDFDTQSDDLRARIQSQFGAVYNDFAVSSLGIMLVDIIAFGLDTLGFYLDRRATDTYMPTARTRKSVSYLSRQLGYRMRGAVASSVDLDVVPADDTSSTLSPFVIPKGFQFSGPNGLKFEAAQDTTYVYSGGWSTQVIPCYEGETITEPFTSDGTLNQVFELRRVPDGKMIADGSVRVTVGGADWTESEFITFDKTNQFETGLNDSPPTVRFGDGVAGNIPPFGVEIKVTYVATTGLAGQVTRNTINEVVTPFVVSFTGVTLEIDNALGSSGGDDLESLEHAKVYAPLVWKSRNVAITQPDYEALSNAYADPLFGKVAVAQAISARSADDDMTLISFLNSIRNFVLQFVDPVRLATTDISANVTSINTALTQIGTLLSNIANASNNINDYATNVINTSRTSKNKTGNITVDAADIQSKVILGKAVVDAVTTGVSDTLTTTKKDEIKAYFDVISNEASNINSENSAVGSSLDSISALGGDISDKAVDIGITLAADGYVKSLNSQKSLIQGYSGSIAADVVVINSACDTVDTTDGYSSDVNAILDDIFEHVDAVLSADCKANLVVVPILTKDPNGFYQAPSTGLITSLQTFLDARKEVTQTVSVTSGADFLVEADISIRVGVKRNYATTVVSSAVGTVSDSILKDRKFGDSLYVSQVYEKIKNTVEGIAFLNVFITGPTDKLDSDGNLIALSSDIITKGSVTITPEVTNIL